MPEIIGILLIISGICLGFYSTFLSAKEVSAGKADYELFISYGETTLDEMWRRYAGMMVPLHGVEEKLAISRGGLYLFLTGFGIFVVSKRRRAYRSAENKYSGQKYRTEQPGPPYAPQVARR